MSFKPSKEICYPPIEKSCEYIKIGRIILSSNVNILEYYTRDEGKRFLENPSEKDINWRKISSYKIMF